jgi:protein-tyrosine phosphatase
MQIECSIIAPGLWMGSRPPSGRTLARAGFHVLALTACEHQRPELYPGVEVLCIDLDDDGEPLPGRHVEEAFVLADRLARRARAGRAVLVTCMQGRNRSGLITALTLARMTGTSGAEALQAVQERRRSPYGGALQNPQFNRLLHLVPPKLSPGVVTRQAAHEAGL